MSPDGESRAGAGPALYSPAGGYKRRYLHSISLGSAPFAIPNHLPDEIFRRGYGRDRPQDLLRGHGRINGKTSASYLKAIRMEQQGPRASR